MGPFSDDQIPDRPQRPSGSHDLLQTLVGIRLRTVTDPESVRHLTWLSDVIAAVSLIQRRLPPDGSLNFTAYLDDVVLFWSRTSERRSIRLDSQNHPVELPEGHVLPLAMITHELISNAFRHGFPDDRVGTVTVAFARSIDGVSLLVRDSGVGGMELASGDGLSLVSGLVEHLGGSMSIEIAPEAGVGVRIRLPLKAAQTH